MTTVILRRHKEESLLRRHHWVFSGAIERIVLDKDYPYDSPQEGEVVKVVDFNGKILGVGHYQIGSIAVRMLAFGTDSLPACFFSGRIGYAYEMRKQLGLVSPQNNTYRLVHGEGDFLPGLVVDIYDKAAVVQAHSVGMHLHRQEIAQSLMQTVSGLQSVYYKSADTLPYKAAIEGDRQGYLIGESNGQEVWAQENGLFFRIDWLQGQKTGFFIDQRDNRRLLEHYAKGRDVLNMFCYTGGFSVYALRGGARIVHSVDVSEKATALADANIAKNFPATTAHCSFARDAFDYMEDIRDRYDLIVLDPPAFAKHRDAVAHALKGYRRLNARALGKIRRGGLLFTFSCSQAVDKEQFRLAVFTAAAEAGRNVRILHQLHQPADHPVNICHPESEYLKGLVLYVE
ncbi:MAG: class I SAM-dependent rRNA methyltransferase [Paludibacteraceae bacterium]|nr:class I SAM-dependent rRNA methyltransferase [Paludibacteraceae bacterium]